MNDEDAPIVSNNLVKLLKQDNLYHTDSFGDEDQLNIDALYEGTENVYFAESFEATSGSGMINHDAIDKVIERPAIMRYNYAFTDYDWESDEDLDEFEENLLKEEIVDAVGRSPNKGSKNLFIDVDNKDVYVSTNTNHGEGRFYGFNAESKMDNCPICKEEVYGDMSMISEEIIPDICGNCDIYIMPQGISCIECGFGDTYGSATPCESCEPIAEKNGNG